MGKLNNQPVSNSDIVNDTSLKEKEVIKEQSISDRFSLLYNAGLNKASNLIKDAQIKYELGNGLNEYNDEYIQGYNTEKGNYIIKISDFEDKLQNPSYSLIGDEKNPNTINSREFANYLLYLNNKGPLSINLLIKKIGIQNTKTLIKHWNEKKNDTIAQKVLKKAGFEKIITEITNPTFLLEKSPYSDDLNLLTQIIPELHYNKIISKIENGEVNSHLSKKFTDTLNESECPNSKVIKFVEAIHKREIIEKRNIIIKEYSDKCGWNEKLTTQLFEKLEKSAENNPCTFDLIKIINDFNSNEVFEYNKTLGKGEEKINPVNNINILGLTRSILLHNKEKIKIEKRITNTLLSNSNLGSKKRQKLTDKLEILNEKDIQTDRALITSTNLTTNDVENIRKMQKQGKTNQEIITNLRETNQNLDKAIINFNKKKNSIKIYDNTLSTKNNNTSDSFYKNNTASTYEGSYRLPLENGGYIEGLTKEEAEITQNPEAAKNLVEFKNTLDDLNLTKLWKHRINIFKSITGPGFSFENFDYLNKNEIKLFLDSVITSITPDLIKNGDHNIPNKSMNLKNYKNELILLNIGGAFSGTKDINFSGDSYLEKIFIDKFINRETGTFHFATFEKATKN